METQAPNCGKKATLRISSPFLLTLLTLPTWHVGEQNTYQKTNEAFEFFTLPPTYTGHAWSLKFTVYCSMVEHILYLKACDWYSVMPTILQAETFTNNRWQIENRILTSDHLLLANESLWYSSVLFLLSSADQWRDRLHHRLFLLQTPRQRWQKGLHCQSSCEPSAYQTCTCNSSGPYWCQEGP